MSNSNQMYIGRFTPRDGRNVDNGLEKRPVAPETKRLETISTAIKLHTWQQLLHSGQLFAPILMQYDSCHSHQPPSHKPSHWSQILFNNSK
jgi:hypothetical protein